MSEDAYDAEFATSTAKLWRAGKMIGGDEDRVRNGLLDSIDALTTRVAELEDWRAQLLLRVPAVLEGIDKCETDDKAGWWETSTGAEFGAGVLAGVMQLLSQPDTPPGCQK